MATPMTKTDFDNAIEEINETAAKKILELERVDKVVQAAVLAEREACAQLCEDEYKLRLAETIRARGEK